MSKMNYAQLKFPPYEYIKSLPLKKKVAYTEHVTKKIKYREEHCEYIFTLFDTPVSTYARFTYNEDDSRHIIFDIMEGGYCDQNSLGMSVRFNKANYTKICKHAQEVYEDFQRTLLRSQEWRWAKKPDEDDFEDEIIY